jgi:potassium-transporting ATPase KdpC subunit
MRVFLSELRSAFVATVALVILLCGIYPLLVFGISQLVFPVQANGSLIRSQKGQIVGSALLAQRFDEPGSFHPRPSAAGIGYDAANSGGSNLGPLAQKLNDQIRERINQYRTENSIPPNGRVPADAVTASASGLDPHITPANAMIQAVRVARVRGLDFSVMQRLVQQSTDRRQFGFLGEDGVNVLRLNLALDRIKP